MSGMQLRILGSLEVEVDGRPVALGGRRQRALLALLLIHADRVVSAVQLAEDLWDQPDPARSVKRLQVGITRLRQALAAGGVTDARLVSGPAGYTLQVEPGALDVHVFERAGVVTDELEAVGGSVESLVADAIVATFGARRASRTTHSARSRPRSPSATGSWASSATSCRCGRAPRPARS